MRCRRAALNSSTRAMAPLASHAASSDRHPAALRGSARVLYVEQSPGDAVRPAKLGARYDSGTAVASDHDWANHVVLCVNEHTARQGPAPSISNDVVVSDLDVGEWISGNGCGPDEPALLAGRTVVAQRVCGSYDVL